jgi:hypothetical protein
MNEVDGRTDMPGNSTPRTIHITADKDKGRSRGKDGDGMMDVLCRVRNAMCLTPRNRYLPQSCITIPIPFFSHPIYLRPVLKTSERSSTTYGRAHW